MPDLVLPMTSAPGLRAQEGAGRLINAYAEKLGPGAQGEHVLRRVPGIVGIGQSGHDVCRGFHSVSGVVLAAMGEKLVKVESNGDITVLGDLGGAGPVTFASNNKSPTPDILCVTSAGVYSCTISAAPTTFTDVDLPQPNSICFIDGYFICTIADGRVFASGLNDTSFAALDFATAEGKPGGLIRGVPFGQQLWLMGPRHIEPWYNAGNATGFPFSRTTVIPLGLASRTAVAGFDDGFSATMQLVANDRRVWRVSGGAPQVASTPDVDRALASVTNPEDIHCLVFAAAGHACFAVTGPGFTWVQDLSTDFWHERASYLQPNWRAAHSVNAFDRWIVGDSATDHIGYVNENEQEEYGRPLIFSVVSAPSKVFPNRLVIPRLEANFVNGQGLVNGREPIQTRPTVKISYSKDGGEKFSEPVVRELGRVGEYGKRVSVNGLGMTGPKGFVARFDVSDPVYVGLMGASFEVEQRPR